MKRTKAFYDEHPFDYVEKYRPEERRSSLTPFLAQTIDDMPANTLVLDIGCGTGRVLTYVAQKGLRCVGLDMSNVSLRIVRGRTGPPTILADNLQLPLKSGVADLVISDGVIHVTWDASQAFSENCRVLKSGGLLYLAVYKPGGRYELLYRYPGSVIRWTVGNPIGKLLVHMWLIPLYWGLHILRTKGKRSWRGAKNLFYDYFVVPEAKFISRDQAMEWASQCKMHLISYKPNPNANVHSFLLKKEG